MRAYCAGVDQHGSPICVVCLGIREGADVVAAELPDLIGRLAHCTECSNKVLSDFNLPFFEHHSGREEDSYYCGCQGWE